MATKKVVSWSDGVERAAGVSKGGMVTRSCSSTRRRVDESTDELPKAKKAKPSSTSSKGKGKGKGKGVKQTEHLKSEGGASEGKSTKTVVIEHCKQCNSFKTRAVQVKNGLEDGLPGITVLVNPEKPRRGCFEIREDGGEKFISLLDMKRPFTKMKALDMDVVIADIIGKIK